MPEDNGGQYGANWSGKGFGNVMVEVMNTVGASGSLDFGSYSRSVDTMVGAFKNMGYQALADVANKGFGQNVSAQDIMSGVSGTILNPNVEMMYQAPEMRGFNIRFKMQARSVAESKEIKRICTVFKRAILPSYGGKVLNKDFSDKVGSFLTVPKVVKVAFMTGNKLNEYVTQYKPCAITALDINHTPDGAWAAYEDGAPVATEIRISFKELKLIFADEISDGAETLMYFNYIPDIEYDVKPVSYPFSTSDFVIAKNFFRRYKLNDRATQALYYDKYTIEGEERPDTVAFKTYGRDNYDWIILLTNNIISPLNEWPMPENALRKYAEAKYDDPYSEVLFYETNKINLPQVINTDLSQQKKNVTILEPGLKVSKQFYLGLYQYFDGTNVITVPGSSVSRAITAYEYEEREMISVERSIY